MKKLIFILALLVSAFAFGQTTTKIPANVEITGKLGIGVTSPTTKLQVKGLNTLESDSNVVINPTTGVMGWKVSSSDGGSVPLSDIIYVDGRSGNDATGRRGDITKPFLTLRAAIDSFATGCYIHVMPGTYTAELTSNSNEGLNLMRKSDGTYIQGASYYFCQGARVIKSGASPLLVGNITTPIRIYGHGTFIKNTTASSIVEGSVFKPAGNIYVEYDSIISSVGHALHLSTNASFTAGITRFSGLYCGSSAAVTAVIGNYTQYELFGKYVCTASGNTINISTGSPEALGNLYVNGQVISTITGYACIGAAKANVRFSGNLSYHASGFGLYVVDKHSYIDADVYDLAPTGGCLIQNNSNDAYADIRVHSSRSYVYSLNTGTGTIVLRVPTGAFTTLTCKVTNTGVGSTYFYGPSLYSIGGSTSVTDAAFNATAGTIFIVGAYYFRGGFTPLVLVSGTGKVVMDGMIDISGIANGLPIIIAKTGGTLVLEKGLSIRAATNGAETDIISCWGSPTIIDKGSIIQSVNSAPCFTVRTGMVASTDTCGVAYYNTSGNSYFNKDFISFARMEGSNLWTQNYPIFDFSTTPKSFVISTKGTPVNTTITLDQYCGTGAETIAHVNAKLLAAGITDVVCSTGNSDARNIMLKPASVNTYQEYFTLVSGTALTTFSWVAGTYKASIYKKVAAGGTIIVDSNVKAN